MEIDALIPSDREAAIALWRDADLVVPWNDPAVDLQRALRGPSSTVLAAYDNGALVGTVMVGSDGHRGWVYYLAVSAAARGRGVGRALMAAGEQWLRARGVAKLNLMVRASNTQVLGFYDALGYGTDEVVVRSRRL